MARQEHSAGILLFRSTGTPGGREYLLLDYGRHWDYPKGHLRKGETEQQAALRELAEETGIDEVGVIPGFRYEMVYFFRNPRRGLVRKMVGFYLASTGQRDVTLSDEHVGFAWLPPQEAIDRVTFASARKALESAEQHLQQAPGPLTS